MRAHATQIAVDGPFFALSNDVGQGASWHRALPARPGRLGAGADGHETDLFAGLGMQPARPETAHGDFGTRVAVSD